MMLGTSCKIALSNTFCGATAVFEYRRNDRFCMQNARREKKQFLNQKGGNLLTALLPPVLTVLGSLLTK